MLIDLHTREEQGLEIAAGIDQMVSRTAAKASKKTKKGKKGHAKGAKPSTKEKYRPTETGPAALRL